MHAAPRDPFAHLTPEQRARLATVQTDARTRALLLGGQASARASRRATDVDAVVRVEGDVVSITAKGMRVYSEANERGSWVHRHRRDAKVREVLNTALVGVQPPRGERWRVTFTREGGRALDSDNLAHGFKRHRDTLAAWLQTDDSPDAPVTWCYQQRRGRGYGAVIVIEPARD